MPSRRQSFRLRWRFSLRTLLCVLTVLAIFLATYVRREYHLAREQRAVEAMEAAGYTVYYDYQYAEDPTTGEVELNLEAPPPEVSTWGRFAMSFTPPRVVDVSAVPDRYESLLGVRPDVVALRQLQYCRKLRMLSIDIDGLRNEHIQWIVANRALKSLVLSDISACDTRQLAQLTRLEFLNLGSQVGDDEMHVIGQLSRLRHLTLTGCDEVSADGFAQLERCRELESLYLYNVGDLSTDALSSVSSLPKLRTLDLHSLSLDADGVDAISRIPSLQSLSMWPVELTDEALERLREVAVRLKYVSAMGEDDAYDLFPDKNDLSHFSHDQLLVIAAYRLEQDRVRELLQQGADVNTRFGLSRRHIFPHLGSENWTPLLAVTQSGQATNDSNATLDQEPDATAIAERDKLRLAIAEILLKAGSKLDLHDGYGATALYDALVNDYHDLALLLLQHGAAVNTRTGIYFDGDSDRTPLHYAVDNPTITAELLACGADVSAQDSSGTTPLHWAVSWMRWRTESVTEELIRERTAVIKLLVEAGADVRAVDHDGASPLSVAQRSTVPEEVRRQVLGILLRKTNQ